MGPPDDTTHPHILVSRPPLGHWGEKSDGQDGLCVRMHRPPVRLSRPAWRGGGPAGETGIRSHSQRPFPWRPHAPIEPFGDTVSSYRGGNGMLRQQLRYAGSNYYVPLMCSTSLMLVNALQIAPYRQSLRLRPQCCLSVTRVLNGFVPPSPCVPPLPSLLMDANDRSLCGE